MFSTSDRPRAGEPQAPPPFSPVVVIPTFNHGATVLAVADRCLALGHRVIIVDDASTDAPDPRTLRDWARVDPARRHLLTHAVNRGKAAALATGFAQAAGLGATHAATIDADAQLEPEDIPALLTIARQSPGALVLGCRPERMQGCPARCRTGRTLASLALLAQCGLRVSDTQCGLRVYPLALVRAVRCHAQRYAFEAEFIARSAWAGAHVIEAPVRCRYLPSAERVSHWRPCRDSFAQAATHARLLARAMLPLPRVRPPSRDPRSRRRALLRWLNPLRAWRTARHEHLAAPEFAGSLAIGAFIGTLPCYGLHTPLGLYAAWRLHQQPAVVVLGSQVSIPPLGVALAFVSITLGHVVLTGHVPSLHIEGWRDLLAQSARWILDWAVGSIPVGLVVAALAFALALALARLAGSVPFRTSPSRERRVR